MIPRLLKEPLLHFLALGAALFLFFQWTGGGSGPGSEKIVLTPGQIDHLAAGFAKTWQRPPTEPELKGLIDDWVREEIAVREAMAAGLDRDDTVIRRRLRQKLEFVVEDVVEATPPTDAQLQEWLDRHTDEFRIEPRVAIRQVYVSTDRRGARADAAAREIVARLSAAGADAAIDTLGDASLLPQELNLAPLSDLDRLFGEGFGARIESAPVGVWSGPFESGYGLHVVLVRERVAGSTPNLANVRPAVEREFLAERRRNQLAAMYERLLDKYDVVVEQRDAEGSGS